MQAESALRLPSPDAESEAHSRLVRDAIAKQIRAAGGFLSFAEYMQAALYAPGLGYYVSGSAKFGREGDFVTAPEVSSLFGRVIASQVAPALKARACPDILEFGAGTGKLAVDVLRRLAELDALPERYLVLEASPDLAARQRERIRAELPEQAGRVAWLADWPDRFRGVVLANEVLDALPVERVRRRGEGIEQLGVGLAGDRFIASERPAPDWLIADVTAVEACLAGPLAEDYESEVAPAVTRWVLDLADHVEQGLVLLFDYGLARNEYYAPDRDGGWLRCHFRHRAHNDPLVLPGIQDITAWVDFSRVAEAGTDAGLTLSGFLSQAEFLLHGGLADEFAAAGPEATPALSREIKLLTLPGEMGEHFKCIGFTTGDDVPVPDVFARADRSYRL